MKQDQDASIPLCIDCDGTLLRTDLLHEATLLLLKQAPLSVFLLPFWLLKGKAYLKQKIAENVQFDWETLPYCAEVLEIIRVARAQGRQVVLATASPEVWAEGIAAHLGVFDKVLATGDGVNLAGAQKAKRLTELFGAKQFDYAGNGATDLPVWAASRCAVVVSSADSLVAAARKVTQVSSVVPLPVAGPLAFLRAMRIHQWMKNLLVLVPLLAAHQLLDGASLGRAFLAFLAFSLCASAVYLLNDLLDLEADRQHIRKRNRPFAAALIPIWQGIMMVPLLLGVVVVLCTYLPMAFSAVLFAYFAMTLAYSLRLKRQVIVDVMLLAALYTMRIIAGAAATSVTPSFWLLAFSMFVFLSLAVVKRYSEMYVMLQQQKLTAAGRGYRVSDLPVLASIGASAGMAAVLVLALYIKDPETALLYPDKVWLWLVPPLLLYWVSRVWMKTCRGEIDDDPVIFAIKDWQSIFVGVLLVACFVLAALRY
jgi:4-hydroxybenzoate polyprenyltransferase